MNNEILEGLKGILDAKLDEMNSKLDSLRGEVDRLKADDLVERISKEVPAELKGQITIISQVGCVGSWVLDPSTTPVKFSGEDSKYTVDMFKFAVEMWFGSSPPQNDSMDDYDLISKIGSLLIGHPARWWSGFGLLSREKAPVYRLNLI